MLQSMSAAQLQEAFRISRAAWRRIAAGSDMIEPMDPQYTGGVTRWSGHGFARWLSAHHPDLAEHTPHLLRPAGTIAPQYYGGTYTRSEPGGFHHEHFAGHWRTSHGRLAVIYPHERGFGPETALDHISDAATVIVIDHAWNLYGLPDLEAVDRERPTLTYEPRWSEVAAHIGAPLPWWPSELRREQHLTAWRPAHPPAAVDVVTWPSWEPLYDMALTEAKGAPIRVACFSIGHEIRLQAVESAESDIAHMNDRADPGDPLSFRERQQAERASMTIPALPNHDDPGQNEIGTEEEIRTGVAQLWQRTDDLAVACLTAISMWSGKHMPFGGAFSVTAQDTTAAGREWIRRLQAAEPTAGHWKWNSDRDEITGTFVDPVTASPVVTERGRYLFGPADHVTFSSYTPRRLPEGSFLREVILDRPVWVRVQDGTLYPIPVLEAPGVSWGYTGSGPGTLATLIGHLLDDGSAPALGYGDGDVFNREPKLEAFLQQKHPRGTRLPRRVLENIRENGTDALGLLDRFRYSRRAHDS
ncbi:hypothetical protein [Parafrankia sp. FMc2]|uniref:hypothetical protein n=1 Tax=Parafrankia sp. FMc2 TaxID=3233196 RepID=UPI0034D6E006